MSYKDTKIAVLGDGGWGTALSLLLAKKGFSPILWGAFGDYVDSMRKSRENTKFLPGFKIPENVRLSADLAEALKADLVVLASPTQHLRSVAKRIGRSTASQQVFAIVCKGIETASLKTPSQIVRDELGRVRTAVISGPNIAREIAMQMPAAAVVASADSRARKLTREVFSTPNFILFESSDTLGVELGGSVKNVIAICAGIVEGMGLGANTRALLFARGLAEMARLGRSMGAKQETFMGLSGLGDLATTCLSQHSRNRTFGFEIGKGRKAADLLTQTEMVVEGVETAKAVFALAKKQRVSMPICDAVYKILFKHEKPGTAVDALLHRGWTRELD